jgi:hypothetical protein
MIKRIFETTTTYQDFYADNKKYKMPITEYTHNSLIYKVLRKLLNKRSM